MLDGLYKPRAVAVIGASRNPLSIGYRVVANLRQHDFQGPIYPVNPKVKSISGFRTYPSILDVPDNEVDLVNISIPAKFVPAAVEQCGKKGVKFIIIHSAGFREVGPEGEKLENEVVQIAKKYSMRIYGPNSQGVMNSDKEVSLYANFTFTPMRPGSISILAQSGGVAELINLHLEEEGVGFRMYGSNGNASDISIDELLDYFGKDEETRVICLYVESFQDPERFVEIASRITPNKPILAIKAGTSAEGARAITSHTGALMSKDTVSDALFERAGVLRFYRQEELVQAAIAFSRQPLPRGRKVTIVTNAGGPAIQATDAAIAEGLSLSKLSNKTKKKLMEKLNPMSSVENPVDMTATAGPEQFSHTIRTLIEDKEVDSLVLSMVTPFFVDNEAVVEEVIAAVKDAKIPTVAAYLTNKKNWGHIIEKAKAAGIPVYDYSETAVAVLSAMANYVEIKSRKRGEVVRLGGCDKKEAGKIMNNSKPDENGFIPLSSAMEILKCYSIPVVEGWEFTSDSELLESINELSFPVVLKAVVEGVVHKTEQGAVVTSIGNEERLKTEVEEMKKKFKGKEIRFVVQKHLTTPFELIAGGKKIGGNLQMIMVGSGGIWTEVFNDAQFRLVPITEVDASCMLKSLKTYPILMGKRTGIKVDIERVKEILLRLSLLLQDFTQIEEIDLNPIFTADKKGNTAVVDARIRVVK